MPVYPKFKPEETRGNRLSEHKIKQIKEMFASGINKYQISIKLGISYESAKRHTDLELKNKMNEYHRKNNKKKYHNDLELKKKLNETRRKNLLIQIHSNPKLNEYNRKKSEEYRKKKTIK